MTISELHRNEHFRRCEFPHLEHRLSLNHAAACPLPRAVQAAMDRVTSLSTRGGQDDPELAKVVPETRETVARLLGASAEEIALVGPTSMALSLVASSLPLRKGDNVVIYQDDFPSNVYPWLAWADRGVEVRFLNVRKWGEIRSVEVLGQVDENTRVVALSTGHFLTGHRIDLEVIGAGLSKRGVLFGVDAIQTAGAFPLLARWFDFAAVGAHKWLLGPCGPGFLYIAKSLSERLGPQVYGWHNVKHDHFASRDQIEFRSGGRRFEVGTSNLAGLAGMRAGIELLLEYGIKSIGAALCSHRNYLADRLKESGWELVNFPCADSQATGILSFGRTGLQMRGVADTLRTEGIEISFRMDRMGRGYLRVAPHFYTTREDLDRFLAALAKISGS